MFGTDTLNLAGFQPLNFSRYLSWGVALGCDGLRHWRLNMCFHLNAISMCDVVMQKPNRRSARGFDRALRAQRFNKLTATANRAEAVLARYHGKIPGR